MPKTATHFVVTRRNWRPLGRSNLHVLYPGEVREAAFPTEAEALADAQRREAEAHRKLNPFHCGLYWADRTHFSEAIFCDFLSDAGIEPPQQPEDRQGPHSLWNLESKHWAEWWSATADRLTESQRERVWEGLHRLRFYEVSERQMRPVAYAVVAVQWNYNDEWYYPGAEGGEVRVAYRSRERAEQECARLNEEARGEWQTRLGLPAPGSAPPVGRAGHELYPFDMEGRLFPGTAPFEPRQRPPARKRVPRTELEMDPDLDPEEDEYAPPDEDDDEPGEFAVDEISFFEVIEFEVEDD